MHMFWIGKFKFVNLINFQKLSLFPNFPLHCFFSIFNDRGKALYLEMQETYHAREKPWALMGFDHQFAV
jgi:hypothetical protein